MKDCIGFGIGPHSKSRYRLRRRVVVGTRGVSYVIERKGGFFSLWRHYMVYMGKDSAERAQREFNWLTRKGRK